MALYDTVCALSITNRTINSGSNVSLFILFYLVFVFFVFIFFFFLICSFLYFIICL